MARITFLMPKSVNLVDLVNLAVLAGLAQQPTQKQAVIKKAADRLVRGQDKAQP
ncbi:hypothetical protein E4U42_006808 [Claviceps africana]|uniref:Uncharacterized protein n=1 Tax=Claviceps africana TaxID=83212 RepID=A0A8K0NIW0_9HYPO|nr:hypothetical protein E4U42_006808 [Claviceps africana]